MKNRRFSALAVIAAVFIIIGLAAAYAEIPHILSYSGRLTDSSGNVVTTAKTLSFKIYDALTAGTALWTSGNYSVTPDSNGVFSVLLGTQSDAIGATVFDDTTRYLEILIEGTAMTPRLRLVSGPYAFRAITADTVADGAITRAKAAGGNFVKQIIGGTNVSVTGDEGGGTGAVTITASVPGALGGTVTTLESGPGLSGGPITVSGTLTVRYDDSTIGLNASSSLEVKAGSIGDTQISTITTAGKVSGSAITSGTIGGTTAINTSGLITSTATIQAASFVGSGAGLSGVTSTSLDGQPGSYYLSRTNHTGTQDWNTVSTATNKVDLASQVSGSLPGSAITGNINTTGVVTATAFSGSGAGLSGVTADTLNSQSGSYYLSRANHTGTQADSTLDTITTPGKVSGSSITSGTIGGTTAINTTGIVTATAFSGSGAGLSGVTADTLNSQPGSYYLSRTNHTGTQDWNTVSTATNKVDLTSQVTGQLPNANLATIDTAGKVSGSSITSGTIGGTTAINTTGVVTATAFSGSGTGLSGVTATLLDSQPGSYYLSRANHTGTQADSTLDTITTPGKVSGSSITSGTIAGSTAINTTGVVTAAAFSGSGTGLSGVTATLLDSQPGSYYLSRANHTGTQADSTLDTITTPGKVSGSSITSGTIAGSTAINTTGVVTAAAFAGSGSGLSGVSASNASSLEGQPGSYYLSRANHTGTQADSTLDTITTPGKVSGSSITSGTIGGTTAINTTGVVTAAAFSGSGVGLSGVTGTDSTKVLKAGDTMTGTLTIEGASSKIIVAGSVEAAGYTGSGASLTNLNADNISSGTLVAVRGGTGQTTYSTGDILYASGAAALTKLALGTAGQVMSSRGGIPSWEAVAGTGTVDQVSTGKGLTGGPITTTGTLSIDSTVVTLTDTQTLSNKTFSGTTTMGLVSATTISGEGSGITGVTASNSSQLGGQAGSYYLSRANHTGTQSWSTISTTVSKVDLSTQVTGNLPDSNLATIGTPGKVSGSSITSGTIGGMTAISTAGDILTTGTITAAAFVGNGSGITSITAANTSSLEGQGGSYYLSRLNHTGTQDWNTVSTTVNKVNLASQVTGLLPGSAISGDINITGTVTATAFSGSGAGLSGVTVSNAPSLEGQPGSYYLSRANHTGTQDWNTISTATNKVNLASQVTGQLPDTNLAVIFQSGKVSGDAITSGTIGGTTAMNTTGVLTAAAFSGTFLGTLSDASRLGGNLPSYYAVAGNLTAHTGASASVHGVTGSVVGTTDIQTLSNKTFTGTLTADAFSGNGAGLSSITAANSASLEGYAGSYYLSRTNHTGTQDWNTISTATNKVDLTSQVTGQLPNANLATIDTAGKVSGSAITSGTIGGTTAINTTGVGSFGAVSASTLTGTLLTTQNWSIIDASSNKVNLATQVTGTLPDWNLTTIGTPGKIDGGAITSGIIGGGTAINTTGVVTAAAFSGPVINAGSVSGPKFKVTPEGGYAILLTNGQGSPVTKGNTVRAKNTVADNFVLTTSTTSTDAIGVVYDDSIANGAEGYIVVSGIAEVQFTTTTSPGNWAWISTTPGQAEGDQSSPPNTTARWQGIGHSIGTSGGAGALAKVILHFN